MSVVDVLIVPLFTVSVKAGASMVICIL